MLKIAKHVQLIFYTFNVLSVGFLRWWKKNLVNDSYFFTYTQVFNVILFTLKLTYYYICFNEDKKLLTGNHQQLNLNNWLTCNKINKHILSEIYKLLVKYRM